MITPIVTFVVVWALIRIVQFVIQLWRLVDGADSPRLGVVAAAQG
jgi:hypothetical protein